MRILTKSIIIGLMLSQTIISQQSNQLYVVGEGKLLEGEIISRIQENYDVNGELAAGLLIISDLNNLTYTCNNGMVKGVKKRGPGEDLLYLQNSERLVTIYKEGFTPLKIILYDYGIYLESGRVWQIEVTGEDKSGMIPITIMRDVEDSKIFIDEELRGTKNSQLVKPGKHILRIEKAGYRPLIDTIQVSTENVYFGYDLAEIEPVPVQFSSQPSGARLILDNEEKGVTNFGNYFYPGTYHVRLIKSGYLDYGERIQVSEGADNDFMFNLKKNVGYLSLTLDPPDATVRLNDKLYNQSEIEAVPGDYELEVFKTGYLSQTENITIPLGDTLHKTYDLSQNVGILALDVTPPDAKVFVNKRDYSGEKNLSLAPGLYQVEISKEGYHQQKESIAIKLGERITKSYSLRQMKGGMRFNVLPINAVSELRKDGKVIESWDGLKVLKDLPAGEYELVCKCKGYMTHTEIIRINDQETSIVSVELREGKDYAEAEFDLNDSYQLYINNELIGTVQNGKETIPAGMSMMKLVNEKETIEKNVTINEKSLSRISIKTESIGATVLSSALLPGLGQVTSGRTLPGLLYLGALSGSIAYHFLNVSDYNSIKDDINSLEKQFKSENDQQKKYELALEIDGKYSGLNDAYDRSSISIFIPAVVYAVNLLDVLIFTPRDRFISVSQSKNIQISPYISSGLSGEVYTGFIIKF